MDSERIYTRQLIQKYIQVGDKENLFTDNDFNQLGITQVATRIFELKREGHPISKRPLKVINRYGESCSVAEYYYKGEEV